jgi:hypothetical protein
MNRAQREAAAAVRQPLFRGLYTAHVAPLRAVPGSDQCHALWAMGRPLQRKEAMDEALAITSSAEGSLGEEM